MLLIRLRKKRSGKKLIFSIIVVSLTQAAVSGKFVEKIGFYKPLADIWSNKYLFINICKLLYWLKRGAKLHNTVFLLLRPLIFSVLKKY